MNLILRGYQQQTIRDTQQSFLSGHNRPLIVLPCGSGKTILFAYMAQSSQAKGKTVWFLVHRRELMQQTIETFDRFNITRETIHIGMIASVANRLDRYPTPDFIIFDEGHHASAATWTRIIDKYPNAKICGLTATPARLDGKPLGKVYDSMVVGISARDLITRGYLSQYKYFAPTVTDLSALKRKGADFDQQQAAELLSERAVFGDVIKHYRDHADGLQSICYCSSIKHSQTMADEFQAEGINAVHFDGNTAPGERNDIISKFRSGEITILCNVDLISEGFDVPDCHCCILLRPTASTALFIQQSMRALRPQPGKTAIILDHVNNYERHGLPDDDREWSLTDKIKPRKEYGEDGKLTVRQCPNCYFTYASAPVCPNCGYVAELTRQEIKNIKEIRLEEIKQNNRDRADKAVTEKTASECKSLMELQAYARKKGFKPGWAWLMAKKRGLV